MTPKSIAKLAEKQEKIFIKKLRAARLEKGLTYEQLAQMAGVHRTAISLIERGKIHPTLFVCFKIALVLKLNINDY